MNIKRRVRPRKDQELHFRATQKDVDLLESLSEKLNKSKSDVVRSDLDLLYYIVNKTMEENKNG